MTRSSAHRIFTFVLFFAPLLAFVVIVSLPVRAWLTCGEWPVYDYQVRIDAMNARLAAGKGPRVDLDVISSGGTEARAELERGITQFMDTLPEPNGNISPEEFSNHRELALNCVMLLFPTFVTSCVLGIALWCYREPGVRTWLMITIAAWTFVVAFILSNPGHFINWMMD